MKSIPFALLVVSMICSTCQPPLLSASTPKSISEAKNLSNQFADIAEKVKASVVSVSTTSQVMMVNPYDYLMGRRRGIGQNGETREIPRGIGSGILTEGGYVLTNNHVIEGASTIHIKLSDGRKVTATVVGTDPETDIAVVKILGSEKLPPAELGDSDTVRVGEWVLAVGCPFGLEQTVTAGIVSAKGRSDLNITALTDFIQTDAAINPGNSGGALVDLEGKVIGINSAIFSQSGGYDGIGFAIPINMAKNVMKEIIRDGKVSRGYLGADIQEMTPQLAEMLKVSQIRGIVVTHVRPDSPAAKAGILPQDILTHFKGTEIPGTRNLVSQVRTTPVGDKIDIRLIRDGKDKTVQVTIEAAAPSLVASDSLGIEVDNIDGGIAKQYGYEPGTQGVIITKVQKSSNAYQSGLEPGDLIMSINRQKIKNLKDYSQLMSKLVGSEKILLQVLRTGRYAYVVVPMK